MRKRPRSTKRRPKKRQVKRATYTVPEAGVRLGLGKNAAYQAAREGQIPVIRIGRRLVVPIAALERMLK